VIAARNIPGSPLLFLSLPVHEQGVSSKTLRRYRGRLLKKGLNCPGLALAVSITFFNGLL
jgi:hypothetical protein